MLPLRKTNQDCGYLVKKRGESLKSNLHICPELRCTTYHSSNDNHLFLVMQNRGHASPYDLLIRIPVRVFDYHYAPSSLSSRIGAAKIIRPFSGTHS